MSSLMSLIFNNNNNNINNISTKSNDLRETTFLFQRLAVTHQRFNSVLLRESFVCDPDK